MQEQIRFALVRSFGSLAEGYARDLSAPDLGETDLIINQLPLGLYGFDLAEKYGIPMALAAVFPLARTQEFPLMGFPKLPLPGYNKTTYYLGGLMAWQMFRPVINRWRKQTLHLSPLPFNGYLERLEKQPIPLLNGFSQHVVSRPQDWNEDVHITGYWFPENQQWQPPNDLTTFIQAGAPRSSSGSVACQSKTQAGPQKLFWKPSDKPGSAPSCIWDGVVLEVNRCPILFPDRLRRL